MKLHEALRALCQKHGNIIVQKKNLVYLISDMGAFEEFPGMREVMKVLVSGGFAKELCSLCLKNDRELFRSRAADVRKALADREHFSREAADFAVDSVSFAFGFQDSVKEPDERKTDYRKLYAESGGAAPGSGKGHKVPVVRSRSGRHLGQLRMKAEKGDADAGYRLGAAYIRGEGVSQDLEEGVRWLRRSAEQGNAEAEFGMGELCMNGLGVEQDDAEALRWYRLAAEKGDVMAQNNLGSMYSD